MRKIGTASGLPIHLKLCVTEIGNEAVSSYPYQRLAVRTSSLVVVG